jgi:hypothetical protein
MSLDMQGRLKTGGYGILTTVFIALAPSSTIAQPSQVESSPTTDPSPHATAAPPTNIVYVYVPAKEPLSPRNDPKTFHRHDRLYLRISQGYGFFWTQSQNKDAREYSVLGHSVPIQLQLGGTPFKGFALGGKVGFTYAYDFSYSGPTTEIWAESPTKSLTGRAFEIGPFIDFFPVPSGGLHISASITYVYTEYNHQLYRTYGLGGRGYAVSPGLGYDFWVSEQWSIGAALQVTMAKLASYNADFDENLVVPSLALTAVYH